MPGKAAPSFQLNRRNGKGAEKMVQGGFCTKDDLRGPSPGWGGGGVCVGGAHGLFLPAAE